jgi:hypothetical protein
MAHEHVLYRSEAREKLLRGVAALLTEATRTETAEKKSQPASSPELD